MCCAFSLLGQTVFRALALPALGYTNVSYRAYYLGLSNVTSTCLDVCPSCLGPGSRKTHSGLAGNDVGGVSTMPGSSH
jgi:hypothetical protein